MGWCGGARAIDQSGRAIPRRELDEDDLAPGSFDDLVADHIVPPVVSTFDQNPGLNSQNELDWCILVEHNDKIHRFERSQHLRTRLLVLNGPTLALEPPH